MDIENQVALDKLNTYLETDPITAKCLFWYVVYYTQDVSLTELVRFENDYAKYGYDSDLASGNLVIVVENKGGVEKSFECEITPQMFHNNFVHWMVF